MLTFSINIGLQTEATTYNLIAATSTDLSTPLSILYDNTNKEITPSDLRNSILTLWSNSIFTQTSVSGNEYVGIDTFNPSGRDLKNKIYLGKRSYSGTYSYSMVNDIMSTSLLNSDVDIFLFNTKRDTISNSRTKVVILSGTKSSLYTVAPYLQSQVVTGTSSLSFDIINPSLTQGSLELTSSFGTVSINNIVLPTIAQNQGIGSTAASNGRLLYWANGNMIWNDVIMPPLNYVGVTGSSLNIYGSPVNVNNYPLQFSDSRPCPISIGDIQIGETFSMVEVVEVLRRIVYTYLPPIGTLEVLPPYNSGYVEVGTSPLLKLKFTISKRTYPTIISGLTNMVPSSYPAITSPGQVTISGTANGIIISPVANSTTNFTLAVSDGTGSNIYSTSVSGIYPYFYGFSSLTTMTTAGLASLTKLVEPLGDKTIDITGSGNLYFIYDNGYPDLNLVLDDSSNVIGSSSTPYSILTLSSPTGLWASKQFKVYQWNGIPQVGPPSVNYQFKY